jgi:hypothetical protein
MGEGSGGEGEDGGREAMICNGCAPHPEHTAFECAQPRQKVKSLFYRLGEGTFLCGCGSHMDKSWDRDGEEATNERVARVEQALREAEERHARELAEVTRTMHTYLRVWMEWDSDYPVHLEPLAITQDDLRVAANGPALAFEVQPDGETLRISAVPGPERKKP